MPADVDGREGFDLSKATIAQREASSLIGRLSSFGFSGTITHGAFARGDGRPISTARAPFSQSSRVSLLRARCVFGDPRLVMVRKIVITWIHLCGASSHRVQHQERHLLEEIETRERRGTRRTSAGMGTSTVVAASDCVAECDGSICDAVGGQYSSRGARLEQRGVGLTVVVLRDGIDLGCFRLLLLSLRISRYGDKLIVVAPDVRAGFARTIVRVMRFEKAHTGIVLYRDLPSRRS
jgi:hypothetical protein